MQTNWRIGSLFGIPLYINYSWFIILLLVTLVNGQQLSQDYQPLIAWLMSLLLALLLFTSVLLHELGHSLAAKAQGIHVNSITLFLFGGVASIERESKTPGEAFQVAIAGPLVSMILAVAFLSLTQIISEASLLHTITSELGTVNLILALFNLIPGLPLDGGQVLKAVVWKFTGDRFSGVRWASTTGKILGYGGISLGLFGVLISGSVGSIWVTLVAWFILRNATAYERLTNLQESLFELKASSAMTRDFRVMDANLTLAAFVEELKNTFSQCYYAASDGRYRGLILVQDLQEIERSEWGKKTLLHIAHPLDTIPAVDEQTSLVEVINQLEKLQLNRLTVLSPAGAVAGVIDKGDMVAAIAKKHNLLIPETEIKRVKTEGTYPPGLQLKTIAKLVSEGK